MDARPACLALALAALTACGPSGGGAPIDFASQPHTLAGLWVETATLNGEARPPRQFCDPGHGIFPGQMPNCSDWRATRTPDGALHLDTVCNLMSGTVTEHRKVVGDLSSAYVDDDTSASGPSNGPQDSLTAHFQFRRLGACPPGMAPAKPAAG